jgi:hypothetical protein
MLFFYKIRLYTIFVEKRQCPLVSTYSKFHVDEVNLSSDRELTGNGTAVSSIFAVYLTYLKNAVTSTRILVK